MYHIKKREEVWGGVWIVWNFSNTQYYKSSVLDKDKQLRIIFIYDKDNNIYYCIMDIYSISVFCIEVRWTYIVLYTDSGKTLYLVAVLNSFRKYYYCIGILVVLLYLILFVKEWEDYVVYDFSMILGSINSTTKTTISKQYSLYVTTSIYINCCIQFTCLLLLLFTVY